MTLHPKAGDVVTDVEGRAYKLGEVIGRGGQGMVFREANNRLAIKIYTGKDPAAQAEFQQRFQAMAYRKTLPDSLVKPEAVLAPPYIGYVMPLIKKHTALKELSYYDGSQGLDEWYNGLTGGLRRRLVLGAKIARAFSDIQYSGLAYCDISPNNVLISKETNKSTICLIDCDNLTIPGAAKYMAIGTPWYIAPELLVGSHLADSLSDGYSLAVLLFQLLTLEHPLMGDAVKEGPPELEKKALLGEYPYIAHPTDTGNQLSTGLPLDIVLSKRLQQLFTRAFVDGLRDRTKRPTPGEWEEALWMASYMTCRCPRCNSTQYAVTVSMKECPWCDYAFESSAIALFQSGLIVEGEKGSEWKATDTVGALCLDYEMNYVPYRLCVPGASGEWGDKTAAVIHRVRDSEEFILENVSDLELRVLGGKGWQRLTKGKNVPVAPGNRVLFPAPGEGQHMTRRLARIHKSQFGAG
ncbi:hypothetical protein ACFPES_31070 [Paenibacillus sp. GCM10023248]|uniref:protein kinase domain-containing protein n=1 Tax=unclassified Paenibacillus TaxID=185978 RepID=UPI002379BF7F|nr:hypothetical protein [Paenibacillus sp. MAHUQ-63]MDD9271486.1 hypothetical protein [Paenibacillus sp. MAHUQ-63]